MGRRNQRHYTCIHNSQICCPIYFQTAINHAANLSWLHCGGASRVEHCGQILLYEGAQLVVRLYHRARREFRRREFLNRGSLHYSPTEFERFDEEVDVHRVTPSAQVYDWGCQWVGRIYLYETPAERVRYGDGERHLEPPVGAAEPDEFHCSGLCRREVR